MDDWTAFSDIGKPIGGTILTLTEYIAVEDAYVESIKRFLKSAGLSKLVVRDPEPTSVRDRGLERWRSKVKEGMQVSGASLAAVARCCLREVLWCRLKGDKGFYVHFGYDYYMYIGMTEAPLRVPRLPKRMFAEAFDSPCFPEEEQIDQ